MASMEPNKTHVVPSNNLTYAYIHHTPAAGSKKPTLLFIHGFPATSREWHRQTAYFHSLGYGVLVPDCLGYGLSSKPQSVSHYIGKSMAADIISILDKESIPTVIGIGHDWGTYLLSQLAVFHPTRLAKLVFFSVPFSPPGRELDVRKINEVTKRKFGFEQYGYQIFLASPEAGFLLGQSWESFYHLAYCQDAKLWETEFAPLNSLKEFLVKKKIVKMGDYVTEEDKSRHHEAFGKNYAAPCMWYVRGLDNLGCEEERRALKAGEIKELLAVETLMVAGLRDTVCPADRARVSMNGTVEGGEKGGSLKVADVDAGHWIMLEKPDETNRILQDFFESGIGVKSLL